MRLREAFSLVGVERCVGLVIMPTSSSGSNFCFLRNAGPLPRDTDGGDARLWLRLRLRVRGPSWSVGVGGGVDGHKSGVWRRWIEVRVDVEERDSVAMGKVGRWSCRDVEEGDSVVVAKVGRWSCRSSSAFILWVNDCDEKNLIFVRVKVGRRKKKKKKKKKRGGWYL